MDFQDDADILSRLGILDSKEESPRKHLYSPRKADVSSERDRFVEVNIDGEVDTRTDSDEEPVFDRNSLLSPNKGVKVYRRRNESYTCVYLVLLLTYAAVGASYPLAWAGFQFDKKIPFSFLLENSVGLLIGCLTGKLLCRRLSLVFLTFLASVSLCGVSWIISVLPGLIDARIICALLGFVSGNILYVGLAVFLIYWRGFNRKALFLYVLITVGSSIILVTHNQPGLTSVESASLSPILIRHKRQADLSTASPDAVNNRINDTLGLPVSNETMVTKPKKPQVAEGIKAVETKSDKNEQMRKAIALNKTTSPPIVTSSSPSNATSSYSPAITSPLSNASRIVTSTTLPSTTASTTTTKRATQTLLQPTSSQSGFATSLFPIPTAAPAPVPLSQSNIWATTVLTTIAVVFYVLTAIFCCIPCSLSSDLKFTKLFDPSIAGLTAGCRIRLASLQTISSFLEGLVELIAVMFTAQQSGNLLLMHYVVVALSRTTIMILGPIAYSLNGCCVVLFFSVLGSVLLMMKLASLSVGLVFLSGSMGTFALMVFLYIEMCVSPRAGTQLDYFIFPMMVGRLLSSALATLMPSIGADQIIVVILLVKGPLIVLFTLLVKSLRKAARLKEIMEYSSSPVLEAIGEYVSLVERGADTDSAEEDDSHDIAG